MNKHGHSPLYTAATHRSAALIRILLAAGARPLDETSDGLIPFAIAASHHCADQRHGNITATLQCLLQADAHDRLTTPILAKVCGDKAIPESATLALLDAFCETHVKITPTPDVEYLTQPILQAFIAEKYEVCDRLKSLGVALPMNDMLTELESQMSRGTVQFHDKQTEYLVSKLKAPAFKSLLPEYYDRASRYPNDPPLYSMVRKVPWKATRSEDQPLVITCLRNIIKLHEPASPNPGTCHALAIKALIKRSHVTTLADFHTLLDVAIQRSDLIALDALIQGRAQLKSHGMPQLIKTSYSCLVPSITRFLGHSGLSLDAALQHACKWPCAANLVELLQDGADVHMKDGSGRQPILILANALPVAEQSAIEPYWDRSIQFYSALELLVEYGGLDTYVLKDLQDAVSNQQWGSVFAENRCSGTPSDIVGKMAENNGRKATKVIDEIYQRHLLKGRPSRFLRPPVRYRC